MLSEPASHGTYLAGEEVRIGASVGGASALEWEGSVWLVFDLGLASEPAELTRSEGEQAEFVYRIRRGDYDGDGISAPEGELQFGPGASLTADAGAVDPALPALEIQPDHRVFARHEPGETIVFSHSVVQLPAPLVASEAAVGCREREVVEELVGAVLRGDLSAAAARYGAARIAGECAELVAGETAIFLSAAIFEEEGEVVDVVLAYGPARLENGGAETANWWTLGDFVTALASTAGDPD